MHSQLIRATLDRFRAQTWATTMTLLALGISIAVPALLFTLVDEFSGWFRHWDGRPQVSVYFDIDTHQDHALKVLERAAEDPLIASTELIPAEQGLKDFRQLAEMDNVLELFDDNPLPTVGVLYLHETPSDTKLKQLEKYLSQSPNVNHVQYDLDWLKRFAAMAQFLKNAVLLLSILLALGVVFLISNTVRLEIQDRHEEINVIDQLGATHSFIRQPFLYFGALEGFLGGISGVLITLIGRAILAQPLSELGAFYTDASGSGLLLFLQLSLAVIALTTLLGWIAARLAVDRHLQLLQPE